MEKMTCCLCGDTARFFEARASDRFFCGATCQMQFYKFKQLQGIVLTEPCRVFKCEDWSESECIDGTGKYFCARHCEMFERNQLTRMWVESAKQQDAEKRGRDASGDDERDRVNRPRHDPFPAEPEDTRLLHELRTILNHARNQCRLLISGSDSANDITRMLEQTGVAVISVTDANTFEIRRRIGVLMSATFPKLPTDVHRDLQIGNFSSASRAWRKKKVIDTGMTLKSFQMPNMIPLVANAQSNFTDSTLKTVHMFNPLIARASLIPWEVVTASDNALHPSQWFIPPQDLSRVMCSEDGIKFAENTTYNPTQIHYDGQPERVQVVFTTDTGPVKLFAVPGSGLPAAKALISRLLGIQGGLSAGFSTHKAAFASNQAVAALLHEFGVAVPDGGGFLAFRTQVWHYEAEAKVQGGNRPVYVKNVLAKSETPNTKVFRVYCGIVALADGHRDALIRLAYYREHQWAMEPFAMSNRNSPFFVAEKSSQAADRADYADFRLQWQRLSKTDFQDMKRYLYEKVKDDADFREHRLGLYGLKRDDLI